jgi:hypothetical protein
MEVSDQCPLVVTILSTIPKANIFRFENFWLLRPDFQHILLESWYDTRNSQDSTKLLTNKYKSLTSALRSWSSKLSNLKITIGNILAILQLIDSLEEYRDLSLEEWNFRIILREKLLALLEQQRIYWKQRGAVKWATLGDIGTKFFHANATIRHRRNAISSLRDETGNLHLSHEDKASVLWESFNERLGQSENNEMRFDLSSLLSANVELSHLESKFTIEEIDEVVKNLPN